MNIFLDGLPDEDFRGWKYDRECHCTRCSQFEEAIATVLKEDYGIDQEAPSI